MQEISEEVILDNYCTWLISLRFLAQADSSLFNFNAIDLSTYLWIKTSILMYRVLLIIHLYKIKISTTNTWKQAHWPKISPEALRNHLRPQSPWKVTAFALHHKVQHQPIADEKRLFCQHWRWQSPIKTLIVVMSTMKGCYRVHKTWYIGILA